MQLITKILFGIALLAIPIGFDRWQEMYDSVLGNIHSNLPDILIIVLICVGVLAGVIEVVRKKDKKIDKSTSNVNQYDVKKLNDEIFRKLMRVECIESDFLLGEKFGLCIPKDPRAFLNKKESDYLLWLVISKEPQYIDQNFDIIEIEIPNLKVGEKYLETHHKEIHRKWIKIKKDLDILNKDRDSFFESVAKQIGKQMKKQFDFKTEEFLDSYGNDKVFFLDNTKKILPRQFMTYIVNFRIENPHNNQYYVRCGYYNIAGSNKQENINIDAIKFIFTDIINNRDLIEKYLEFNMRSGDLNKALDSFGDQLEEEVVNDINARE